MSITIVIADDHQLYRVALRYLLESTRARTFMVVGEASDGIEVVEKALELRPDVVLMDVAMPRLMGMGATRRIRERSRGIQILGLSAHIKYEYVIEMLKAGASGYLEKDCGPVELHAAIKAVVRGDTYLSHRTAAVLSQKETGQVEGVGLEAFTRLTAREREVLKALAEGASPKEVAVELGLSEMTVHTHRKSIMEKLHLRGIGDMVRYAIRSGLIEA